MKIASIDIGTNTLRLLIGSVNRDGHIVDTLLRREITRLGGGFDGTRLHAESKRRTLKALKSFSHIIHQSGVERIRAAATSVMREAEDGGIFATEIREKTGIEVQIISGEVEAALTLKGVLSALDDGSRKALIFDIGGGSTEYIVAEEGKVIGLKSLNMGVVSLTEKYLRSDPPASSDLLNIEGAAEDFLQSLLDLRNGLAGIETIRENERALLVGTAGTITSLAALAQNLEVYDTRKINNYVLTKKAVDDLFTQLSAMTHKERAAMAALEEGRADLIIAGTLIVKKTMEDFGFSELTVSDYGLLEGLLLDEAAGQALP